MSLNGMGQQSPVWSLFNMDQYNVNAAYAGFDRSLSVNFHVRNQWNALKGGVQNQSINAHLPLYILNGGVGISAQRDETGPFRKLKGGLSYNYVYPSSKGVFSFGGELSLSQLSIDGESLRSPDGQYDDSQIDHRDDDLPVRSVSGIAPDLSLSALYRTNDLTLGIGVENIISSDMSLSSGEYNYKLARAVNITAAYNYELTAHLTISGYGQLLTDFKETQAQIGGHLGVNNNIYGGVSFRGYSASSTDALIFIAGIRISEHFILFYAHDYLVSPLKLGVVNNTHEFTLNYNLNELIRTGLPPKVIYNPRF
jgi:type IX secretion system PorP/SprF family membrane protein